MLDDFGASPGRGRVQRRPQPSRAWRNGPVLEGAAWAENVPFQETRDYVKKVLANTTFYAAMLTGQPQSLKARLGMVGPRDADLPAPAGTCLDAMTAWDTIRHTVVAEFSDLGTRTGHAAGGALVLVPSWGLLGLQRERQGKDAGIRTHMLVAASSALIVLVPVQMGMEQEGLSRVIQGLLAGVGFVCAGAILKLEREEQVHGLTTAAGVDDGRHRRRLRPGPRPDRRPQHPAGPGHPRPGGAGAPAGHQGQGQRPRTESSIPGGLHQCGRPRR